MKVIGVDTSMTRTGWAAVEGFGLPSLGVEILHGVVVSKPGPRVLKPGRTPGSKRPSDYTRRHEDVARRLDAIADALLLALHEHDALDDCELIVVESPSLGSRSSNLDQLWGLYWIVLARLSLTRIPIVTVAPNVRAKYATGDGHAAKVSVVSSMVSGYELSFDDDNEVDATVLAVMGMRALGAALEQQITTAQQQAMSSVLWPQR